MPNKPAEPPTYDIEGRGRNNGDGEVFFFSSRRRHTRLQGDWSSDVCSSDLDEHRRGGEGRVGYRAEAHGEHVVGPHSPAHEPDGDAGEDHHRIAEERFSAEDR